MPDSSAATNSKGTLAKIESFLRRNPSDPPRFTPSATIGVRRKPLPRHVEEFQHSSNGFSKEISPANEESDTASSSSLSITSSLRHRKSSQNSWVSNYSDSRSSTTHAKATDIMLHVDENRLNELLEEMLDQMGLDEDKRAAVRNMPKDSKWMMVYQHLQKQQDAIVALHVKGSPEYYTRILKDYLSRSVPSNHSSAIKTLNAIRVSISTQPITWVKVFISLDGLSYLLELLDRTCTRSRLKKESNGVLDIDLIRCIKAFMNNKMGLRNIMNRAPKSIQIIAKCLSSPSFHVTRYAAELLTVICYTDSPYGHKLVVDALNEVDSKQQSMYLSWMNTVSDVLTCRDNIGSGSNGGLIAGVGWVGDSKVTEKEILEFLITNLILANAIVSVAQDLDFRVHIRNQLYQVGFGNVFLKLQEISSSNEILRRQAEQFREEMNTDWTTYQLEFEHLKNEFDDPENILRCLIRKTEGTRGRNHLLSILQHLLGIRKDSNTRSAYLHLIDLVISQIVLNGKGIDPDFTSCYPLDLSIIIDNFVHHDDLSRLNHENALLKQMVDKLLTEKVKSDELLETLRLSKHEQISGEEPLQFSSQLSDHYLRLSNILDKLISIPPAEIQDRLQELISSHSANNQVFVESQKAEIKSEKEDINISVPSDSSDKTETLETSASQKEFHKVNVDITLPSPPPPPPPPPPGMMINRKPAKQAAYTPRHKMKQMQWEKILDHEIKETFWNNFDERWISERLSKAGIWEDLEFRFAHEAPISKTPEDQHRSRNPSFSSSKLSSKEISIIDSKKSYNLMILLSRLKHTPRELGKEILRMNEQILTPSLVNQLLNYYPTAEEIGLLSPYMDDESPLVQGERFLIEMMRVDKCNLRLRALSFRYMFDERMFDLENSLSILHEAVLSVTNCLHLREFLQLLLVLGNVLNGRGFRGGAYGFKVISLNSLACTKSITGETLLEYVVLIVKEEFPELIHLHTELEKVNLASRISLQHLQDERNMLQKVVLALNDDFLKMNISHEDPLHNGVELAKRALKRIKATSDRLDECVKEFHKMIILFGDEVKDVKSEDWFGVLKSFLASYKKAIDKMNGDGKRTRTPSISSSYPSLQSSPAKDSPFKRRSLYEAEQSLKMSGTSLEKISEEKGLMDNLLDSLRNGPSQPTRNPQFQQERKVSSDYSSKASELLIKLNEL